MDVPVFRRPIIRQPDGTFLVTLTRGQFARIDACDLEKVSGRRWTANRGHNGNFYALGWSRVNGRQTAISMNAFIMQTPSGMHTDHINGDTLDNRRCNLRVCTPAENSRNVRPRKGRKFKGVFFYDGKKQPRWYATFQKKHLGAFNTEAAAARAYDREACIRYGEFARLNFPGDDPMAFNINEERWVPKGANAQSGGADLFNDNPPRGFGAVAGVCPPKR